VTNSAVSDGEPADSLEAGDYLALTEAPYDGFERFADYVSVRDGTRIAVDYYRPARHGVLHSEKLPVVWVQDRYLRAIVAGDRLYSQLYQHPALATLLRHGYVIAAADVRGSGASFGATDGWFSAKEAQDAYDITEWLASRPWSSGKVGMSGRSYRGIAQYFAAAQAPPSLKAIIPEMAYFESYDVVYPGGIFGDWWLHSWSTMVRTQDISAPLPPNWLAAAQAARAGQLDPERERACFEMMRCPSIPRGSVAPVDEDLRGESLARATEEHKAAPTTFSIASRATLRDSNVDGGPLPTHVERSPGLLVAEIAASHIAAYHIGGWFDGFTRGTLLWFRNYPGSSKLLIGPWFHPATGHVDMAAEYLRWFDHWLKGVDNSVMREPAVTYFTLGAPPGRQWRTSKVWPLSNQRITRFYFYPGKSGSVSSINDGILLPSPPKERSAEDRYTIDYTTTAGIDNRWTWTGSGGLGDPPYAHMRDNDEKGLTYSTEPLKVATEVTGHPIVHLWMAASTADLDIFAYLEEVSPDGISHYVTEGQLRASHRGLDAPPYDRIGLPYHRGFAADLKPLVPGAMTELVFDLQPTSILFHAGNRIRLTLTGADKDTFDTPIQSPPPSIAVARAGEHSSYLELPIIPP
jgi:putative CocE/NonD family hydrolase